MHSYFKYDAIFASDLYGIYNGLPCKSHTDRPLILYLLLSVSIATRDIVSGNAVNFKAGNDHIAIYVEEVHEGAHILCFGLINI